MTPHKPLSDADIEAAARAELPWLLERSRAREAAASGDTAFVHQPYGDNLTEKCTDVYFIGAKSSVSRCPIESSTPPPPLLICRR
jgi:hypothetical protein